MKKPTHADALDWLIVVFLFFVAGLLIALIGGCGECPPPTAVVSDPNAKCCECLSRTLDAPGGYCSGDAVCYPDDASTFCLSLCGDVCGGPNVDF